MMEIIYNITLVGGLMLEVDERQGKALKELKANGKPSDTFEIDENMYEIGRVKAIEKSWRRPKEKAIIPIASVTKDRCKGKYSIQKEIMSLIKKKYPTEWPKYFQDQAYKEKVRLWLRESASKLWCDAKTNECACTSDYVPTGLDTTSLLALFPNAEFVEVPDEFRKDLA